MIKTKKELDFYLQADRMMNRNCFKFSLKNRLKNIITPDWIMLFLATMRKLDYYTSKEGGVNRLLLAYYRNKYKKLEVRLGFSIDPRVFGYGLVMPHHGTIVVGEGNKIGNYAVLHTSTCITEQGKQIGNGLYLSAGVKMTHSITLGNGISIGANSLVNKSIQEDNCLVVGTPAKKIKDYPVWYEKEKSVYKERVKKVEELKKLFWDE